MMLQICVQISVVNGPVPLAVLRAKVKVNTAMGFKYPICREFPVHT